jgi:hypothetical protein
MSTRDAASVEYRERIVRQLIERQLSMRADAGFAVSARIVANELEALAERFRLVIPHLETRAQRVDEQQRWRSGAQRVLALQLGICAVDRFHHGNAHRVL